MNNIVINPQGTIVGKAFDSKDIEQVESLVMVADSITIDSAEMRTLAHEELTNLKSHQKRIEAQRLSVTRPLDEAKRNLMAIFKVPEERLQRAINSLSGGILAFDSAQARLAQEAQRMREEEARLERLRIEGEERRKREEAERQQRAAAEEAERHRQASLAAASSGDMEAAREAAEAEAAAREAAEAAAMQKARAEAEAATAAAAAAAAAPKAEAVSTKGTRSSWKGECFDKAELIRFVASHPEFSELLSVNQTALNALAKAQKSGLKVAGCKAYEERTVVASRGA